MSFSEQLSGFPVVWPNMEPSLETSCLGHFPKYPFIFFSVLVKAFFNVQQYTKCAVII